MSNNCWGNCNNVLPPGISKSQNKIVVEVLDINLRDKNPSSMHPNLIVLEIFEKKKPRPRGFHWEPNTPRQKKQHLHEFGFSSKKHAHSSGQNSNIYIEAPALPNTTEVKWKVMKVITSVEEGMIFQTESLEMVCDALTQTKRGNLS